MDNDNKPGAAAKDQKSQLSDPKKGNRIVEENQTAVSAERNAGSDGRKSVAPPDIKTGIKTVGYLRVSTVDQSLDKFRADVLQFAMDRGFGRVEFVSEKVSGKKPWRKRALNEVVMGLQAGDRLIVPELSRLGRSMLEVLEIIQVAREAGACIYAIKGGWELNDSIQSKIVGSVMAMMAEVERDLISERTKEALAARRRLAAGGKTWISKTGRECSRLGRPKGPGKSKLDVRREEIVGLLKNGSTKTFVAKRYGCTVQNLANWLKKNDVEI